MMKQIVGACSVSLVLTAAASAQIPAGGEFRVNTYTTGRQYLAHPAMEPDGDFLVAWSGDGKSILVRGAEERPLTLYRIDLASGRRERWKELAPPDLAGFLEYGAGPMGVRVTPDFQFYAYNFYTDLENLKMTELGKSWWK